MTPGFPSSLRHFALPVVLGVVSCVSARPTAPAPASASGAANAAPAAILVPAIHRTGIGAVDADRTGRFLLALDGAGFAAVHDLEQNTIRLSRRIAEGGEPRAYARIDADARYALVAFTEDEDDADAVAVWDLRRDRLVRLPNTLGGSIRAIGTDPAIETIAFVVQSERTRLEIRDRELTVRCVTDYTDHIGEDVAVVVRVSADGHEVEISDVDRTEAIRVSTETCELRAVSLDDDDGSSELDEPRASVSDVGEGQVLHVHGRDVPLAELPTFATGGEFAVRDFLVDPEVGTLYVATRESVVAIGDAGTSLRCAGGTDLIRAPGGHVFALDEGRFCDVARGTQLEALPLGFDADGRLFVSRETGGGHGDLEVYDPATGGFVDPPAFLADLEPYDLQILDEGRLIAVRDERTRSLEFRDLRTGVLRGRLRASDSGDVRSIGYVHLAGELVVIQVDDARAAVVRLATGEVVRFVDHLLGGYASVTGAYVQIESESGAAFAHLEGGEDVTFEDAIDSVADGLAIRFDGSAATVIEIASRSRLSFEGRFLSFDPVTRDLAIERDDHLFVTRLDAAFVPEFEFEDLGPATAFPRFARVGDYGTVRSMRTTVELLSRGKPTIAIHLARVGDGLAAFATDDLGRVAVLGGDAASLRMRPAGDALTVALTAVVSDPVLETVIHDRLHASELSEYGCSQ